MALSGKIIAEVIGKFKIASPRPDKENENTDSLALLARLPYNLGNRMALRAVWEPAQ